MAVSQGFKVELNDMHGKPKLVRVYNKGGSLISSTEYKYNVKDDRAEAKELDNVACIPRKWETPVPYKIRFRCNQFAFHY